jgi:hypothetical protein
MIVASDAPGYFGPHADMLAQMLDSPSNAAKIFTMRIIAVLAPGHPEYVAGARGVLLSLAMSSPHNILKEEASRAHRAVINSLKSLAGGKCRLPDNPAIASLYEMPVWQLAIESHLSTAYGSDLRPDDRQQGRRAGTKRDSRPSERSNLYQEFIEKLKQGETTQSFDDQISLLSQDVAAEAMPGERAPVDAAMSSPLQVAEMPLPVTDEPMVTAQLAEDIPPDSSEEVYLQKMMDEVRNDFSSRAGGLLDALGMGHMKRESGGKGEEGNHKISGKELVSALEKLVRKHKSKVL